MKLMKQIMDILEKMGYNEWPSRISYERQHMVWSKVKIIVATRRMMLDIESALDNLADELFITVKTQAIKRAGKVRHYMISVHQKGDSMLITNSQDTTAVCFPHEDTNNGDQASVMMSKVEADALTKIKEKAYMDLTRKKLKALASLSMKKNTGVVILRMKWAGVDFPQHLNLTSEFRHEIMDAYESKGGNYELI